MDMETSTAAPAETQVAPAPIEDVSGKAAPVHKPSISEAIDNAFEQQGLTDDDQGAPEPKAETEKPDKPIKAKEDKPQKEELSDEGDDADSGDPDDGEADGADGGPDDDDDAQGREKVQPKEERKPRRPTVPAPEKFSEDAKKHWPSVPHVVRQEIERIQREHEGEAQYSRQVVQRYNALREYDDFAAQNGVDLRDTLRQVRELEEMMPRNPVAGFNRFLQTMGPRHPDGRPMSVYEFAQEIVQAGPQAISQHLTQAQAQQQQQQVTTQQQQLAAQNEQLRREAAKLQIQANVIAPFEAANPRLTEKPVREYVEYLIGSGKIPPNLDAAQRLQLAYDEAVRVIPVAADEIDDEEDVELEYQGRKRPVDGKGKKRNPRSSAPPSRTPQQRPKVLSIEEAVQAAMSKL